MCLKFSKFLLDMDLELYKCVLLLLLCLFGWAFYILAIIANFNESKHNGSFKPRFFEHSPCSPADSTNQVAAATSRSPDSTSAQGVTLIDDHLVFRPTKVGAAAMLKVQVQNSSSQTHTVSHDGVVASQSYPVHKSCKMQGFAIKKGTNKLHAWP